MRILTVDVGTGTQDILLFDSTQRLENCVKMVMPSPTAIAARRIRAATTQRQAVALTGFNMGGGPCRWALEDHLKAGLTALATPRSARTFDDDLSQVEALGVRLISEDEINQLSGAMRVRLSDLDMEAIRRALAAFDVDGQFDGVAIAVLDHGEAPPGVSDRLFRFEHLRRIITEKQGLLGFAYLAEELPPYLTRMRDISEQVGAALPLLLLDTGAAAAVGALEDPMVGRQPRSMIVNTGNMHTMAIHLENGRLLGLFEHHTGALKLDDFDRFLSKLSEGTLSNREIFDSEGHGCHILHQASGPARPFLSLTGPQRSRFAGSAWQPYMAVPHGDMMIAGCFGLLRGFAARKPEWRDEIERSLSLDDQSGVP